MLRMALEKIDNRPLRKCVRVIIRKDNNILLGLRKDKGGKLICFDFFGGGVEDVSFEKAVRNECLEETGIEVKDIQQLSVTDAQYFTLPNPERAKIYAGGEDFYFTAKYHKENKSLYDSEGDAMDYIIASPVDAIKLIESGPYSDYNEARIKAINEVNKKYM